MAMAPRGANRYPTLFVVMLMLAGCADQAQPSEPAHGSSAAETTMGSVTAPPSSLADPSATPGAEGPGPSTKIRQLGTALPLADGRVLLTGPTLATTWEPDWVEPYDPTTGQSGPPVSLTRQLASAAPLLDGRVLFAGGIGPDVDLEGWRAYLATAEIYDPATGRVSPSGSTMAVPRVGHTATPLPDGRVLIAGGIVTDANPVTTTSADLYDPTTGAIRPTGQLGIDRAGHTAVLLDDGRVLLFGGHSGELPAESAEIYDPTTEQFHSIAGPPAAPPGVNSALLEDGRVLVAGMAGDDTHPVSAQAVIYDPQSGKTGEAGELTATRGGAAVTRLLDGRVLITGGYDGPTALASAEVFDPDSETFSPTGELATARGGHSALLLPDGRVLIVGGESCEPDAVAAEIFDPASGSFQAAPGSSGGSLGSLHLDSCPP